MVPTSALPPSTPLTQNCMGDPVIAVWVVSWRVWPARTTLLDAEMKEAKPLSKPDPQPVRMSAATAKDPQARRPRGRVRLIVCGMKHSTFVMKQGRQIETFKRYKVRQSLRHLSLCANARDARVFWATGLPRKL
jgi:hypothetical protein